MVAVLDEEGHYLKKCRVQMLNGRRDSVPTFLGFHLRDHWRGIPGTPEVFKVDQAETDDEPEMS